VQNAVAEVLTVDEYRNLCCLLIVTRSRDSVVSVVNRARACRSGVWILAGARNYIFLHNVHAGSGTPTFRLSVYKGLYPRRWSGWGMRLTTCMHLLTKGRMSRAVLYTLVCLHDIYRDSLTLFNWFNWFVAHTFISSLFGTSIVRSWTGEPAILTEVLIFNDLHTFHCQAQYLLTRYWWRQRQAYSFRDPKPHLLLT